MLLHVHCKLHSKHCMHDAVGNVQTAQQAIYSNASQCMCAVFRVQSNCTEKYALWSMQSGGNAKHSQQKASPPCFWIFFSSLLWISTEGSIAIVTHKLLMRTLEAWVGAGKRPLANVQKVQKKILRLVIFVHLENSVCSEQGDLVNSDVFRFSRICICIFSTSAFIALRGFYYCIFDFLCQQYVIFFQIVVCI